MITVYGIKNCDTVKKATKWLDSQNIAYSFFDFKKQTLGKIRASMDPKTLVVARSSGTAVQYV